MSIVFTVAEFFGSASDVLTEGGIEALLLRFSSN
jgi:hypothetical protein